MATMIGCITEYYKATLAEYFCSLGVVVTFVLLLTANYICSRHARGRKLSLVCILDTTTVHLELSCFDAIPVTSCDLHR